MKCSGVKHFLQDVGTAVNENLITTVKAGSFFYQKRKSISDNLIIIFSQNDQNLDFASPLVHICLILVTLSLLWTFKMLYQPSPSPPPPPLFLPLPPTLQSTQDQCHKKASADMSVSRIVQVLPCHKYKRCLLLTFDWVNYETFRLRAFFFWPIISQKFILLRMLNNFKRIN